ncbi:MAG: PaaI family thioesterase [Rhodospirillaceae bacterium]|nr:PaaI family thioesterase [Rhodospirillaceae bacterium]
MNVHPGLKAVIETVLVASPMAKSLGLELTDLAVDQIGMRMPFRPQNVTVAEMVHGGAIAGLIDTAGAVASASGIDPDGGLKGGATSAMTIHYLSPANGVDLAAKAIVIKRSISQTISEISVRGPDGQLVAKGVVTSRLF